MKILCRYESMASSFIYRGLGLALQNMGHEFRFWHPEQNSAFDIFNEYMPDIFLGQGYNLTRAEIKCINNRPDLKCLMKVGIWGEIDKEFDHHKYDALFTSPQEKINIDALQNKSRLFLFNYGTPSYENLLMKNWKDVAKTFIFVPAADIHSFYPKPVERLETDIAFLGGYWEYKGRNLNKYILPLCHPVGKYKIKIFGNQAWPVPQYLGFADDVLARQVISSAKICPAAHEPHANAYGYEIESRVFHPISCGTLAISDNVEGWHEIFAGELPMFDDPDEYHGCIDYYLKNDDKREALQKQQYDVVMNNHTYEHRVKSILSILKGI